MGAASTTGPRLTGWFVTARHRTTGADGTPRPWGGVHVKRVGEPRTACGVVCLGWQVFWHVPAAAIAADLCGECSTMALAAVREPAQRCDAC